MSRVRRPATPVVVESTSQRVRRVRPSTQVEKAEETPVNTRISRVRRTPEPVQAPTVLRRSRVRSSEVGYTQSLPIFVIDWNKSLGWKLQIYLVTSYLYYHRCKSLITDHDYDRLCKELAEGWRGLTHQHKHLVDKGQLTAGTGYAVKNFPLMVQGAAEHMLRHYSER